MEPSGNMFARVLGRRGLDASVGARPVAAAAAAIIAILLVATLVLWAYYGTAVFYEMIAAGLAACF
jgi:hypothetical protein